MNVLITGATGFIGSHLCEYLESHGHAVGALSRNADSARERVGSVDRAWNWSPAEEPAPAEAVAWADAVVHLAGESVDGRWTAAKKRAIRESRVAGTSNLVTAIGDSDDRPDTLVSASAIGYYGDRGDERIEESSSPENGFLAEVCRQWEEEARAAEQHGLRVVRVRTGIVLGEEGGALEQMLLPAKLGLTGPLGSGRQWWSWVHIDDHVGILAHALGLERSRVLNSTAPNPVRQVEFARTLGRVLGRPAFVPAPAFMLRLLLGGFAGELLASARVLPAATRESGYEFRHPELETALRNLVG